MQHTGAYMQGLRLNEVDKCQCARCLPANGTQAASKHCYAGPMPCFLWSAVLQGGKVQEGGRVDYTGFIRAR